MSLKDIKCAQNLAFHSQTMSPPASTRMELSPQSMSPPASTHMELSPPSTPSQLMPSPVPPLYTSSPSHASSPMYPTHSKRQPFCEDDTANQQLAPQQKSTQFDMSSTCSACHATCMPMPSTPEVTIARSSLDSVSLEQHLQHSNTGREEAMQSFILDRFLPAAKAVATDYDRTLYTASKHHTMKPSMTSRMSTPNATTKTSHLQSFRSTTSASKGVTWSSRLSRDGGEMECSDDEEPTKSSGFFCVGLKTAITRVHKVVHPSASPTSRSKSRAARSFSHDANSDEEEEVLPKVNVLAQGMQKRWNGHTTASYAFSSCSPNGQSSRYMASPRNSHPKRGCVGQDGSPFVSLTSLDATPLHNMAVNCHSIGPLHQQFRCNCSKQSPLRGGHACQGCLRPRCHQSYANCHWEHAKESSGGTRLKDYPLQNASRCRASDASVQDFASRASSKGSMVRRDDVGGACSKGSMVHREAVEGACSKGSMVRDDAVEGALRDPDYTEDDEHEFYDAFDSWSSIPGNVTPLTCTSPKSPKISGSSRKWTSDEDGMVDVPHYIETPHAFDITSKVSGCDANYEGLSKYFWEKGDEMEGKESSTYRLSCGRCASADPAHTAAALNQKHGTTRADRGKESFSRIMNGMYSSNPSSPRTIFDPKCQIGTFNGHKKWSSPPEPGWPLGISHVQSGTKKSSLQDQTKHDDKCVANLVSTFTESSVPSSPRVPPSPTGSWLGKAMALNASKPSTLATLQQKEKVVSARKKLEFTLSDAKKEVKWEDVVKGSQMHPEHFRFSKELRHGHPSNRNAIKPLRL